MRYEIFREFMDFCRNRIGFRPNIDDLKLYIKGGYAMRIGPCIFEYNSKTRKIEQVHGPDWDTWSARIS